MQLDFTSDQDELRDAVRSVLSKECPVSLVREHVDRVVRDEPSSVSDDLWQTFASLDWQALTVPEEAGGVGLGMVELAVVAEELGRAIAPSALLPTIAGFLPAVREAHGGGTWAQAVASGGVRGAFAAADDGGAFSLDGVAASVDAGGTLQGSKRFVLGIGEVDEVAVAVRHADGFAVAVVPVSDLRVTPVRSIDPSRPLAHLDLHGVQLGVDRVLPIDGVALVRAAEETTVALALELVGTCQSIFDTNLAYAKERQQFGVPIGSFQAVKHKLANMYVAIERARAVALFAVATIAEDDDRRAMATAMAKAAAGECQRLVTQDGIQLLGGIGYTWEHDQQLFVKRAKADDALFGSAIQHRRVIAEHLGI